jgi:hypothetical protein
MGVTRKLSTLVKKGIVADVDSMLDYADSLLAEAAMDLEDVVQEADQTGLNYAGDTWFLEDNTGKLVYIDTEMLNAIDQLASDISSARDTVQELLDQVKRLK